MAGTCGACIGHPGVAGEERHGAGKRPNGRRGERTRRQKDLSRDLYGSDIRDRQRELEYEPIRPVRRVTDEIQTRGDPFEWLI